MRISDELWGISRGGWFFKREDIDRMYHAAHLSGDLDSVPVLMPGASLKGLRSRTSGSASVSALALLVGVLFGVGLFTFGYARGASYLTDDPAACVNCHVMRGEYEGWMKASHRKAAVCNDCHTPAGFAGKYSTKVLNGFWHSFYFTTGWFPDHIRLRPRNVAVTEKACLKCHSAVTEAIQATRRHGDGVSCTNCHANVGHVD